MREEERHACVMAEEGCVEVPEIAGQVSLLSADEARPPHQRAMRAVNHGDVPCALGAVQVIVER